MFVRQLCCKWEIQNKKWQGVDLVIFYGINLKVKNVTTIYEEFGQFCPESDLGFYLDKNSHT